MRKIYTPYIGEAIPTICGGKEYYDIGLQKWENFLDDFDIKSEVNRLTKFGRKGWEIFDYLNHFKFAYTGLMDHVVPYRNNHLDYIIVSQPYGTIENILYCFTINFEFLYYCMKNKYQIDLYANDMYNWHHPSCKVVIFQRFNHINDWDINYEFLKVNVHIKEDDNDNVVKEVLIKPSVIGWDI